MRQEMTATAISFSAMASSAVGRSRASKVMMPPRAKDS